MVSCFDPTFRFGILGGGQLGKMLTQAAQTWHVHTSIMDPDANAPARSLCSDFQQGSLQDPAAIAAFGTGKDLVTIEIESVNVDALEQLEQQGTRVYPGPAALRIIQDKGLQKQFFVDHALPTSDFTLFDGKAEIEAALQQGALQIPFVQKTRRDGYDGKGVAVIRNEGDLEKLVDAPCLVEDLVAIRSELSVITARRPSGDIAVFSPVEMIFNPEANLVEMLLCPASISPTLQVQARKLATAVTEALDVCGLLAVELFLDPNDRLWINEVAPRPHNSGHHTLASTYTSQYEQHLRAIFDLPLGSTESKVCAAMVNLLGEPGHTGAPVYHGINECLQIDGCTIHIYGKKETRPFRKMGHATVIDRDQVGVLEKAHVVQQRLKVRS